MRFIDFLKKNNLKYKVLNQQVSRNIYGKLSKNLKGAQVRILSNGKRIDCWPGSNNVTLDVDNQHYYDDLGLDGILRLINDNLNEQDKTKRRT